MRVQLTTRFNSANKHREVCLTKSLWVHAHLVLRLLSVQRVRLSQLGLYDSLRVEPHPLLERIQGSPVSGQVSEGAVHAQAELAEHVAGVKGLRDEVLSILRRVRVPRSS